MHEYEAYPMQEHDISLGLLTGHSNDRNGLLRTPEETQTTSIPSMLDLNLDHVDDDTSVTHADMTPPSLLSDIPFLDSPQVLTKLSFKPDESSTSAKQGFRTRLVQRLLGRSSKWTTSWRLQSVIIGFFLLCRCNSVDQ